MFILKFPIIILKKILIFYNTRIKKKFQAHFFKIERFSNLIEIYKNKKFFLLGNTIIFYNKLESEIKIDLKDKSSLNLFIISFKNNVFEYYLDEKKFQKLIQLDYVNYIKIPIKNERSFEIKQKENFIRTFKSKKITKKNLSYF